MAMINIRDIIMSAILIQSYMSVFCRRGRLRERHDSSWNLRSRCKQGLLMGNYGVKHAWSFVEFEVTEAGAVQ
jgi:hypothetical protein